MNAAGGTTDGGYFDHEKLIVYQKSLEFQKMADALGNHMPAHRRYLADQLHRSAVSITLNIAEGAGEFSPKEKVRFYRIAKRSATESSGTLDSMLPFCKDKQLWDAARALLIEINSMMIGIGPNPIPFHATYPNPQLVLVLALYPAPHSAPTRNLCLCLRSAPPLS